MVLTSSMGATLRSATAADIAAIEALLSAAALPTTGIGEIVRATPNDAVVAEREGAIVAAGALEVVGTGAALLRSIVVRDDQRSTGIGRALVLRLLANADARDLDLYLLTTTADRWFPQFGFVPADRASAPSAIANTWEFKTGCSQTAVAMMRPAGGTREPAAS
ncbi:MAG: GNAT family N-acetyltransferase [Gemmatimonadetes bacterium]|nr:GNAT family N-acetyltransferase [Gemmatimonadota bacterium]